jgi:hypothetical protein
MFGNVERGPSAIKVLQRRDSPWLVFDEASGIRGHGGATGGQFSLRYGACLAEFLSAAEVPGGRFTCQPATESWEAAREIVGWPASSQPVAQDSVPAAIAGLAGTWYGLLGESVVSFALVGGADAGLGVLYRVATPRVSGGVFSPTLSGKEVRVRLPSKSEILIVPGSEGTAILTWTSADRSRTETTTLRRAPR